MNRIESSCGILGVCFVFTLIRYYCYLKSVFPDLKLVFSGQHLERQKRRYLLEFHLSLGSIMFSVIQHI